ncbi:chloride channel CLIC-like protein 1 isoform X2 [Amia ocellicauda]|uniref:chloride channel CLIC-like protein 1 isoform X2 n=1 Tax=Amia ocellicauda TaxID=2972642 RepID=UPI0034643F12
MEESFVGLWSWLKWQWLLREETVSEPSPWSPVFSWSLYSQAFLWASLLFLAGLLVLVAWRSWTRGHGRSRGRGAWLKAGPDICLAACQRILVNLLLLCVLLSVPWEWVRLYQIEMAKKMAVLSEGWPQYCSTQDLSYWDSLKAWFSSHFTWRGEACERYQRALMVEPFWEVTPLMALASAVSRVVVQPMELGAQAVGRSLRLFMLEVMITVTQTQSG